MGASGCFCYSAPSDKSSPFLFSQLRLSTALNLNLPLFLLPFSLHLHPIRDAKALQEKAARKAAQAAAAGNNNGDNNRNANKKK
ncbi:hypothetical protein M9H77_01194 [Catharanthus roseus]|uniref:Uncharacterized protein n=1 Tax=Catharanthus roseus TaxID=4058 RepID=A0ACC0C527_CATRO|nr:hypothetical protein M9H77_01194 [Catharanthus roseus]